MLKLQVKSYQSKVSSNRFQVEDENEIDPTESAPKVDSEVSANSTEQPEEDKTGSPLPCEKFTNL